MQFVEWIAEHSELSVRDAYDRVVDRVRQLRQDPERERQQRDDLRGRVTRERLVERGRQARRHPQDVPRAHGGTGRRGAPGRLPAPRELEEELLGREELGHDNPEVWRMECVGFGINLLSGNYE